jgi:hypothetical protein
LNGTYKEVSTLTSKEFRILLRGRLKMITSKFEGGLDISTKLEYFKQVKKLTNTRNKNTLLRIWNGDCLSYTRLFHLGLVQSNKCPNCENLDTPEHMLFECEVAKKVWELIMVKFPKPPTKLLAQYAIGINDSKICLIVKAEIMKHLMHFRELQPEVIVSRTIAYLKIVQKHNQAVMRL